MKSLRDYVNNYGHTIDPGALVGFRKKKNDIN